MPPRLNFRKMRLWCADNGWTDFGPYGGVPSEEGEGEGEGREDYDGGPGPGDEYDDIMDREDYLADEEYDQTAEGDEDVA